MAEVIGGQGSGHPNLNLTAEEKQVYGNLLRGIDTDGIVSGDQAVKFFERTRLPPDVLGQIWQIADTENRGFLTPAGFGVVLRLIGHAQNGRSPSPQIATQVAPLPKFDGQTAGAPAQPSAPNPAPAAAPFQAPAPPASPSQTGAPPIRVPPLSPEKVAEYSQLFEKSGAENGILNGVVAKQIFERARLPIEVLGRIWGLSDTQGRGALDVTEFVVAMHLLASYKSGQMRGVPSTLPPGLYDAASRRPAQRTGGGSRPGSSTFSQPPVAQQFTGQYGAIRPQSPISRQQVGTPLSTQSTGEGWIITPADKARFDSVFATVDKSGSGYLSGEQAVEFFGNARLPEEVLAQIWDLSDINSEGRLNKDEFAVAMYLIRQQRGTRDGRGNLPATLPMALIPPSMRRQQIAPSQPTAPAFENAPVTKPRSAADDLFGLDAFGSPPTTHAQIPQSTGGTDAGPFGNAAAVPPAASPITSNTFKPFIPSSTFGQSLQPQSTGTPSPSQSRSVNVNDDLLGDTDPHESSKLTNETTELANLSNQVGTLSKQMTDLQGTRGQTEQELSQQTAQKRAFESRLGQLRTLYENEAREVKALQTQLQTSKTDTKRLQSDYAVIDATHQDLSTQHQQLRAQFETDQRENAALKEKIRLMNQEVDQLKPQLEKLKSDARQQKGLVAINKKQLATNEAERDRLKTEIATAQKELEDSQREHEESARQIAATQKQHEDAQREHAESTRQIAATQKQLEDSHREHEESARQIETSKRELGAARSVPVAAGQRPPIAVASPAPSTTSNPFFNRATSSSSTDAPPAHTQNNFDSIFGPSFGTAAAPAPTTSFAAESPAQTASEVSRSIDTPTSSTAPDAVEPPVQSAVKQITSESLPFRQPLSRNDSLSSSVKVNAPVSRLSPASTPRAFTPGSTTSTPPATRALADPFAPSAADEEQESVKQTLPTGPTASILPTSSRSIEGPFAPSAADEEQESVRQTLPTGPISTHEDVFGQPSMDISGMPGGFPESVTPRPETPAHGLDSTKIAVGAGAAALVGGAVAAATTMNGGDKGKAPAKSPEVPKDNFDEYFGGVAHQRTPSEQTRDFDSAFASMKPAAPTNGTSNGGNQEFPDIQEVDDDDDDDDESSDYSQETPLAFDDNFNSPQKTAQPPLERKGKEPAIQPETQREVVPTGAALLSAPRPELSTMASGSSLPDFDASEKLTSPPGYGEAVPDDNPTHFPREYKGLLPEREDPTSPPPTGAEKAVASPPATEAPPSYGPEIGERGSSLGSKPPAPPPKSSPFDFDSAFTGVGPAAVVEEESDDDEDVFRSSRNHAPGFDPSFDSPAQSRSTTAASNAPPMSVYSAVTNGSPLPPPKDDFFEFNKATPATTSAHTSAAIAASPASTTGTSHDWDDIFSGLSSDGPGAAKGFEDEDDGPSTPTHPTVASTTETGGLPASTSFQPLPQLKTTSPPAATAATTTTATATGQVLPKPPPIPESPERPALGRAISTTSEHDDPILKRLTAMGWSRGESLDALEKFDYNIDKAADYLTFKS